MNFIDKIFGADKKRASIEKFDKALSRYKSLLEHSSKTITQLYQMRKSALTVIKETETQLLSNPNIDDDLLRAFSDAHNNIREFEDSVIQEENIVITDREGHSGVTAAAVGVATATAISTLGPSAAIAVATTFGTAATGTAITTLSGVAATNAALAWLGGGALATGGGGMAAGSALLALVGPIGVIAGVGVAVGGGVAARSKNRKVAEEINIQTIDIQTKCERISTCCRDIHTTYLDLSHDISNLKNLLSSQSANYYEVLSIILRLVNSINKRFSV